MARRFPRPTSEGAPEVRGTAEVETAGDVFLRHVGVREVLDRELKGGPRRPPADRFGLRRAGVCEASERRHGAQRPSVPDPEMFRGADQPVMDLRGETLGFADLGSISSHTSFTIACVIQSFRGLVARREAPCPEGLAGVAAIGVALQHGE